MRMRTKTMASRFRWKVAGSPRAPFTTLRTVGQGAKVYVWLMNISGWWRWWFWFWSWGMIKKVWILQNTQLLVFAIYFLELQKLKTWTTITEKCEQFKKSFLIKYVIVVHVGSLCLVKMPRKWKGNDGKDENVGQNENEKVKKGPSRSTKMRLDDDNYGKNIQ